MFSFRLTQLHIIFIELILFMAKESDVPIPVRFNPFKHHRNYILFILEGVFPEEIAHLLDPVCNNYIDIYTEEITPEWIGNQLIGALKSNQAFHEADFTRWLGSPDRYRIIRLEDLSEWIVRKSAEAARYIYKKSDLFLKNRNLFPPHSVLEP